ncbi:adenylyl-sulfate kinase [Chitinophaga rhizophila]|uniref:Adenylyl-sulfate kinase n=1 Tax=Chitinophaga rhizophila TaxID=2866212 RepID=A0ABS7G601_9BACT|nr:adenylyl-sulfate kinase [Chitinophaga rhizophila]MBW8683058.1 adenylyl-sulfate kinase [Chitinophaga rhizophila]
MQNNISKPAKGKIVWLTGLSGAGKTTLARGLEEQLKEYGISCMLLDGDLLRKGINSDLGYTREDRKENVRRIAEIARLFSNAGQIAIVAAITPYQDDRDMVREMLHDCPLLEVFVACPLEECEKRDVKGLYKKAREKKLPNFTGITDIFESPANPDLILQTDKEEYEHCLQQLCFATIPQVHQNIYTQPSVVNK